MNVYTCVDRNISLFLCLLSCPASTFSSRTFFYMLSTLLHCLIEYFYVKVLDYPLIKLLNHKSQLSFL